MLFTVNNSTLAFNNSLEVLTVTSNSRVTKWQHTLRMRQSLFLTAAMDQQQRGNLKTDVREDWFSSLLQLIEILC